MLATLVAYALFAPAITVNVNAQDGETISSDRVFRVTVQAENPVTQVEFYVGEDLRETDSSTPYEFKLSVLDEAEGPVKLTFAAYTSEGENAKKVINAKVDIGLSKGADFHVQRGTELLSNGKFDDAIMAGRIALKAKAGYGPARLLMARAYYRKGVYDQAQKFAEDVVLAEPNNAEANELLAGISLQKAFTTFNAPGSDKKETLEAIRQALKTSAESRRRNLEAQFDAAGTPTEANALAYSDTAMRSLRFSAAISTLSPLFRKDDTNNKVANRLAYAQIRTGRFADARITLNQLKKRGAHDAYGFALTAIVESFFGNNSGADEAIKEGILSDSEDMGVRTAQVFLALQRGQSSAMRDLAAALSKDAGQRSEVLYYLSIINNATQNYVEAEKQFQQAVLADPTIYPMYIERANQALALAASGRITDRENLAYQFSMAGAFFEAALACKPDAPEVLTGMAISAILQSKPADAVKYARSAASSGPTYAAAHYVLAGVSSLMQDEMTARAARIRTEDKDGVLDSDQRAEIAKLENEARNFRVEVQKSRDLAEKLDTRNLSGRPVPTTLDAFNYYYRYGRLPLLTLPN